MQRIGRRSRSSPADVAASGSPSPSNWPPMASMSRSPARATTMSRRRRSPSSKPPARCHVRRRRRRHRVRPCPGARRRRAGLGPIDLLVSNAGIAPPQRLDLLEATEANFEPCSGSTCAAHSSSPRRLPNVCGEERRLRLNVGLHQFLFGADGFAQPYRVLHLQGRTGHGGRRVCGPSRCRRIAVFEIRPGIIRSE